MNDELLAKLVSELASIYNDQTLKKIELGVIPYADQSKNDEILKDIDELIEKMSELSNTGDESVAEPLELIIALRQSVENAIQNA